jgi:hypothetical protein
MNQDRANPGPSAETTPHAPVIADPYGLLPNSAGRNIAQRLLDKFGPGDVPRATTIFFRKIERIVLQHGEEAYQMVCEALGQSMDRDKPSAYFSKTIIGKFRASGWWDEPVKW